MNFLLHINIYLFPMILLAIILVSMKNRSVQSTDNRLFQMVLMYTLVVLCAELLSWVLEGIVFPFSNIMNWILNLIYFMIFPYLILLWLNYVYFCLFNRPVHSIEIWKKLMLILPLGVYYVILLLSVKTKWVFSIDAQNYYVRGPLFFLPYAIEAIYISVTACLLLYEYKKETSVLRKKSIANVFFYTMLPVVGNVLQLSIKNLWILLPITAFAELLLYMQKQNKQITNDALTGLNNRSSLDNYLKNQAEQFDDEQHKYLFMTDLDKFKQINDKYGHGVGDEALINTASILKEFFSKSDAFLARYGGDEFCIITSCQTDQEAIVLERQLQMAFAEKNQQEKYPYSLEISVGFARLDEEGLAKPEEIIKKSG